MKILDLFCGAGGAAMGYHRAFPDAEIVGVDINPQPRYPFTFVQGDAMVLLQMPAYLDLYDLIHASPPCQRYSRMTVRWGAQGEHPDLVAPTRERLRRADVPYVIENVEQAPLLHPTVLCGSAFGLGVRRHRSFECSFVTSAAPPCRHAEQGRPVGVYGHSGGQSKRDGISFGGGAVWSRSMQIDWMTNAELAQAIPPAYTEWIGQQFHLQQEGVVHHG